MANLPDLLRQAQILILKILNVFLWLIFSPSLNSTKFPYSWTDTNEEILGIGDIIKTHKDVREPGKSALVLSADVDFGLG